MVVTTKSWKVATMLKAINHTLHELLNSNKTEREGKCNGARKKIYSEQLWMALPAIEATGQILKIDCLLDKMMFLILRLVGLSEQEWFLSLSPV